MLEPRDVLTYLVARGHLKAGAALDDLTVEDASRKNTNWKVLRKRGMCYFVKQARDAEGAAHLANEALIYQFLHADALQNPVRRFTPRFLGYDAGTRILVVELFRRARNLREHHVLERRFPAALGADVAQQLASLHRIPIKQDSFLRARCDPPWIFWSAPA